MDRMYRDFRISPEVAAYGRKIEALLKERFDALDQTAEYNQWKVINAMQKNRVNAECLSGTTGYGYDDFGRDTLEKVYADCFRGEAALVRPQITCGTHALALALMSNLRPGDELLSPVENPTTRWRKSSASAPPGIPGRVRDYLRSGGSFWKTALSTMRTFEKPSMSGPVWLPSSAPRVRLPADSFGGADPAS